MKCAQILTLVFVICFVPAVKADDVALRSHLEEIISHSGIKRGELGIAISNPQGKSVFTLNSEKHFIPASISKLVTTAAVMNTFNPFTKFHTQIYVDGEQTDDVLTGDIYLKGMGDPAFVSEKMWMLVNEFTRSGIKKITGQLVADDSFFDSERFDPGREADRNDRAYDAPVGALSFDWNSTTILVRPGAKAGAPARVFADPENNFVVLKNNATTSKSGTDLVADRAIAETGTDADNTKADEDIVTIHGKISIGAEEHHIYKNISNPPLYAAAGLREFLHQRGIEVAGKSRVGQITKSAKLVADLEGEPLSRLITDMNKFSNNFVAEMLAKDLAAFKTSKPGKMSDGLDQIRNFLHEEMHWKASDFTLANVSGFTRKNSFTPDQFVELLSWYQKQFRFYPEFLQSLPVSGTDGTLHKRMLQTAPGWVRAKTGLLNGVVALAGYAGSADGSIKLFTFIFNGHGDEGHVRDTFDTLAAALVK